MNLKALSEILVLVDAVRQAVAIIEATVSRITSNPDEVTADELALLQSQRRAALERLVKLAD